MQPSKLVFCLSVCFSIIGGYLILYFCIFQQRALDALENSMLLEHARDSFKKTRINGNLEAGCPKVNFIPPIRDRFELGELLRKWNFKIGVELGVQSGRYSHILLETWGQADEFYMVDLWAPLPNYMDSGNVDANAHIKLMENAQFVATDAMKKGFVRNCRICRNLTSVCVGNFKDSYFDFIYVDARHDYKVLMFTWAKLSVIFCLKYKYK